MTATDIIKHFNLIKHPEGGYYKEVYRSKGHIPAEVLGEPFKGDRNYATSIYFLLKSDEFSAWHRIKQDEIWHFYQGSSIKLHMISPEGSYSYVLIGNDFEANNHPQYTVPANVWFAAEVIKSINQEDAYAFVGCGVSPGFDFKDFELPSRAVLTELYPQHSGIIAALTYH